MSWGFSLERRNLHVYMVVAGMCLLLQNCKGRGLIPHTHTHIQAKTTHTWIYDSTVMLVSYNYSSTLCIISCTKLITYNVEVIPETRWVVPLSSTMPLTSLKTTLWPVCRPCGWLSMQVTTPGLSWRIKRRCIFGGLGGQTLFLGHVF